MRQTLPKIQVSFDQIIPMTAARDTFSRILSEIDEKKYLVISRRLKPAAVVVSPSYFADLLEKTKEYDRKEAILKMQKLGQETFLAYLKSKKIDPKKLTDEDIEKLLGK